MEGRRRTSCEIIPQWRRHYKRNARKLQTLAGELINKKLHRPYQMSLLCPGAHVDQVDPWRLWRQQDKTEALYGITPMFGLLKKERIKIFFVELTFCPGLAIWSFGSCCSRLACTRTSQNVALSGDTNPQTLRCSKWQRLRQDDHQPKDVFLCFWVRNALLRLFSNKN